MTKIRLTKKGYKAVQFIQVVEGKVGYLCNNISQTLETDDANRILNQYLKNGWTKEVISEKPSMAPTQLKPRDVSAEAKNPTKKQAIREWAIKKYGEDSYSNYRRATEAAKSEINEWVKTHRRLTKAEYKDQIQRGIKKYMALYTAEM